MTLALFDKTTPAGKAFRTGVQAALAITGFVAGLALIPGFYDAMAGHPLFAGGTLVTIISVVTYVHNALEKLWKWLNEPYEG